MNLERGEGEGKERERKRGGGQREESGEEKEVRERTIYPRR